MTNEEAIKQLEFLIKTDFHVDTKEACRTAISALEKQIKLNEIGFTEEVIENYKIFEDECITKGFTFKSLLDAIDKPINGGWVKCSERLPKESGDYLCYEEYEPNKFDIFIEEIDCDGIFKQWNITNSERIIAWQPLPTPYQESEVL